MFVLISFSATSEPKKSVNAPVEILDQLLTEKKYSEAKQLSNGTFQQSLWHNKISNTEKCLPFIEKCETVEDKLNIIRKCIYEISLNCNGRDNREYNYPPKIGMRLEKTYNELIRKNEELPKDQIMNLEKFCESGLRWGYQKEKSCSKCARAIRVNLKNLYGQFLTKDKCEESRLLELEGVETGNSCLQRYLGEEKSMLTYELIAMSDSKKINLNFDTITECEDAQENGYEYYTNDLERISLLPLGRVSDKKIINKCRLNKKIICRQE